jgi:hypothetical protein
MSFLGARCLLKTEQQVSVISEPSRCSDLCIHHEQPPYIIPATAIVRPTNEPWNLVSKMRYLIKVLHVLVFLLMESLHYSVFHIGQQYH